MRNNSNANLPNSNATLPSMFKKRMPTISLTCSPSVGRIVFAALARGVGLEKYQANSGYGSPELQDAGDV